ncbi:MAG: phosphoglycerate dehydrogenase-like enzyme [Alpinimonas sp.]
MLTVVGLGPVAAEIVQPVLGPLIRFIEHPTPADLTEASGAIVRAAYVVGVEQLDAMPKMRVLARTGVGTELVDVVAAASRGIPVLITPGSNTNAVAEGVFAHALHLVKRLGPLTQIVAHGRWSERTNYPVQDLEDQTIGIVGYGRIGRRVADLASAFGMRVLAFDPYANIPAERQVADLMDLAKHSNVITLHVPLTDETRHVVNADFLGTMAPGAVLINCGRGPLLDLEAAHAALLSGQLAGLGLDVFDEEPPAFHPIFTHENVVLTPHVMGLSINATRETFRQAAIGIKDVLEGRPAAHQVQI